jgi:hypothetical protein
LNLDGARVIWYYGDGKGNVFVGRRNYGRRPLPVQRATKAQLRSGLTHAALM